MSDEELLRSAIKAKRRWDALGLAIGVFWLFVAVRAESIVMGATMALAAAFHISTGLHGLTDKMD